jgi:GNAT superfamily N-acetyltransferase
MIRIRTAESDADLEAWRRVRMVVVPNERAPSVDELRRVETPDRLLLLAELDGELTGSGLASRSEMAGLGSLAPRVLPEARRRGVGTALFRPLAAHVDSLGFTEANSTVGDEESFAFAKRFGWREVDRQMEQVRTVGREEPPHAPDGVELVSLAERPDLSEAVYTQVAVEALADIPVSPPLQVSLEDWERGWTSLAEGTFLALAGDEVVGCAGLMLDPDRPDRAEHSLTAVRRDRRGRGFAKALKQATIAWAAANGIRELYTWTQRGNEPMQQLNERLGYVVRSWCTTVRGPVGLR